MDEAKVATMRQGELPEAQVVFIAVGTPPFAGRLPGPFPGAKRLRGHRQASGRGLHCGHQQVHGARGERQLCGGSVWVRAEMKRW